MNIEFKFNNLYEYYLYIPSSLCCNYQISKQINYQSYDILQKEDPARFKKLIKDLKKFSKKSKKIFLGLTNNYAVFVNFSVESLNFINIYLQNHKVGSSIVKIILSDDITEKESLKVLPKTRELKYEPIKTVINCNLYISRNFEYFFFHH